MKVKVFTLPWRPEAGGFDDSALQAFLLERIVLEVTEHFFIHENVPVLVLTLRYRDESPRLRRLVAPAASPVAQGVEAGAAPPSLLDPEEQARFEALRVWRNQHAKAMGRPPYLVLTNRQLAEIAAAPPKTLQALAEIRGVGPSRIDEFGKELLDLLGALASPLVAAPASPKPPARATGASAGGAATTSPSTDPDAPTATPAPAREEEALLPVAASLQGWASHGDTFRFCKAYQARLGRVAAAG